MEIVLATQNLHKIREFREIFKTLNSIDLLSLLNFPDYIPPEETEDTFEANAKLKAVHAAKSLGKWVLADDSGLVVPALEGAPGVYSRRYAGHQATDKQNRVKLLNDMKGLSQLERSAFFQCTLVLANEKGPYKTVTGIAEGYILEEETGREGFGYDSLFQQHDSNKSFGEMSESIKNRVSHRRKAFDKMALALESIKE